MAPTSIPSMCLSRWLLPALLVSCSGHDDQREIKAPVSNEATTKEAPMGTAASRRAVRLKLTFDLTDTAERGKVLVSRSGTVDVELPYFDPTSQQRAVVPITLEGGLAACISIESFYRGDPKGDPPDSLVTTVHTRWKVTGTVPPQFESNALGGGLDGKPMLGTSATFRWGDVELRAQMSLTATPSTNRSAVAPPMVATDAADGCVGALAPRVISSIRDL